MTNKPVHLYFTREEDIPDLQVTDQLCADIDSMSHRVIMCTSWSELPEKLKLYPETVCFNYRELNRSSATEIVNMVQTMSKLVNLSYEIKISVDVGKHANYEIVKSLQKSGIHGIIPRPADFGWEECLRGADALWAGIPYWPKHIMDQLPRPQAKIKHILFKPDAKQYLNPRIIQGLKNQTELDFDMFLCENWLDMSNAVDQGAEQMVIHISVIEHLSLSITEIIEMINTRVAVVGQKIAIMVAIESNTPVKFIKELKKTCVLGILPAASHWGLEEWALALSALTRRQTHWPTHIIDQLPGAVKKEKKDRTTLTSRQQEVFKLVVERGVSNKVIAKMLNLSESTVKLHLGVIFKKYGVKNRTQLAVFAKNQPMSIV